MLEVILLTLGFEIVKWQIMLSQLSAEMVAVTASGTSFRITAKCSLALTILLLFTSNVGHCANPTVPFPEEAKHALRNDRWP